MVDVSEKKATARVAVARGRVQMQPRTLELISANQIAKGNVINTARVAGIMAAKQTASLIPMCHQLNLTHVQLEIRTNFEESCCELEATAKTMDKTGVEMEALVAVSTAALTVYDMVKAVDQNMIISEIKLVSKTGGKHSLV